jgi:prepilin-type processing-associated H-X9-DG protein
MTTVLLARVKEYATRRIAMPKLVWFNQPTNHSGTVNFLFLDPDGEVGRFTMYVADGGGPYILGGPALSDNWSGDFTDAARTLLSLLPAEIHIFPQSSGKRIRQAITKHRAEISDESSRLHEEEWGLLACSKAYTTTQCCDMLLQNAKPTSAIVFVDKEQDGDVLLAVELAKVYYGLPQRQRKKLKLGPDWEHHWDV